METPHAILPVCDVCGAPLTSSGGVPGRCCLACLIESALDDPPGKEAGEISHLDGVVDPAPTRFAHYEIGTGTDAPPVELGRGAMGVTYRATDTVLRCPVALKVINVDLAAHPRARARFLREARAAASLRHPHVASVFFFGERPEDGQPFYAMELVEGETLQARVRRTGGLPVGEALEIISQVAGALAVAEKQGLTHRDLKPANLMLVAGGGVNVKVIDFGLAKAAATEDAPDPFLTGGADFVGTPAFASPEQFDGWQGIDTRSDFYALGATLWFALTGQPPFPGHTLAEIHDRQKHGSFPVEQLRAARVPRPVADLLRSLLSPDPAGRPQTAHDLALALDRCKKSVAVSSRAFSWKAVALTAVVLGTLLAAATVFWSLHRHGQPTPADGPGLDKSIAVLPFDNLSTDKANAFFADGVQDEILTGLARIADLKVISRTSVLGYRDADKRPPAGEIGRALGVAYLLEGSVQREGSRVHLTAKLIDAAHDRSVWAQSFDGSSADIFSMQSEVADTIAGKLQAQLSRTEKAALTEPPTRDLAAYELYLHAKELIYNFDPNASDRDPLREAARVLEEATARDPEFYAAWVLLTNTYGNLLRFKVDPNPATRTLQAEKALGNVRRLRPEAGETHLTAALYYYNVHDPARGRPELDLARQMLPNNVRVLYLTASTGTIDGRWAEAVEAIQKSRALNPRHVATLSLQMIIYTDLRRFDDARRVAQEGIAAGIAPDHFTLRHALAVEQETGDTSEIRALLRRLAGQGDANGWNTVVAWDAALRDRDFDEAARVVAADPRQEFNVKGGMLTLPRAYLTGDIAWARGDLAAARKDFETVRPVLETAVRNRPEDARAWSTLGLLDARLGREEDALREAWHGVALAPVSRDGENGPGRLQDLAWVYAQNGDKDRALTILESLENVPGALDDYGDLARHPDYDMLRGEGRFEAILQAIRQPVDLSKFNPADFPPPVEKSGP